MRIAACLALLLLTALPFAARAGDYSPGYRYGYRGLDRELYCERYNGAIHSNYRRLQRDYDRLSRRLNEQSRNCTADAQQQQIAYQQVIDQQRGMNADLLLQQDSATAMIEQIADAKAIPPELLDRPTRAEFEELQERYDTLLQAYRNLERDHRALGGD